MTTTKSYVIWNNKGGVGKSTITFHVATVYAEKNPQEDVVVIDMCPQANSSMTLLGGGNSGEAELQKLMATDPPKTIVGYITDTLINGQSTPLNFVVNLSHVNNNVSTNLFLMCGDGNLELISPLLSQRANALPLSALDKPWEKVHSIVANLTSSPLNTGRPTTYFIDTNPSFSIYTQLAILGGEYLLVPINADDSSIYAIVGLFNLIWGSTTPHPVYDKYTFSSIVNSNGMRRPLIYSLLGNRFTQKKGSAHAFKALSIEATRKMYQEFTAHPNRFRQTHKTITNQDEFEEEFTIELRDFNSAGVVAANQGQPLNKLDKQHYTVYGEDIQVSKDQRDHCKRTIEALITRL